MIRHALVCATVLAGTATLAQAQVKPSSVPVSVTARAGSVSAVEAALGRGAIRVQRRRGTRLQVEVAPSRVPDLRRLPGVLQVDAAATSFSDEGPVVSQGVRRTGASALATSGRGGEGLTIAILDLGFGTNIAALQAAGELPGADTLETQSFDTANGLAGRTAYGTATNHGELVAQTVFDYAPRARYIFINYRTEQDFLAAVDSIVARRPDIVVHSNSFIEGPFDGTSVPAQAVNRASDAGILWFNSAGNYQRRMWSGPWADADADGAQDFPGDNGGVFWRQTGQRVTFALTWTGPGTAATDLDLALERRNDDGTGWTPVAASQNRQATGGWHSERFVGYVPPADGFFRVRITRVSGPAPEGAMTLVTREIDMSLFGGSVDSSVPTPGDAAGAVAVGAVDWRGDTLEEYSSIGPTDDGRMKPDLVAPTDTALAGPSGPRLVGGTSNAAPNAAGAAALLMSSLRAAGQPSSAGDVRAQLAANALDLGAPGPDNAFGAGRVRVDMVPPTATLTPASTRPVRGPISVGVRAVDPSGVVRMELGVDASTLTRITVRDVLGHPLDTRTLADGPHTLWASTTDWAGNTGRTERVLTVDNTRPVVELLRMSFAKKPTRKNARKKPPPLRPVTLRLRVRDRQGGQQQVQVRVDGRLVRNTFVPAGSVRPLPVGRRRPGPVVVQITARDLAGNVRTVRRVMRVR